jgi:hypothetical protein
VLAERLDLPFDNVPVIARQIIAKLPATGNQKKTYALEKFGFLLLSASFCGFFVCYRLFTALFFPPVFFLFLCGLQLVFFSDCSRDNSKFFHYMCDEGIITMCVVDDQVPHRIAYAFLQVSFDPYGNGNSDFVVVLPTHSSYKLTISRVYALHRTSRNVSRRASATRTGRARPNSFTMNSSRVSYMSGWYPQAKY